MAFLPFLDRYSPKTIGIFSLLVLILSIVLTFYAVPEMIESNVKSLNLKPGSQKRIMWEKTPFPLTFKVYMFNLTNPLEVVQGKKPKLQETGPYVFDEWKHKENIVDHEEEDAVSFDMINTYHFRPDLSKGSPGDIVTIPHVFLMGGLIGAKRDRAGLLGIIVNAFKQIFRPVDSPFLTTKVMDILFDGSGIDCNREDLEASIVCPNLATQKGLKVVNETYYSISLFGSKNASSLGRFKVNRGIKDISKTGQMILFDEKNESIAYTGTCNMLNGTDGTIFAPFQKKTNIIQSFSPAFCRTLPLTFVRDGSYNSVPTSVFTINFNDLKKDSSQHCFCRQQKKENCPPKGVFDLYACTGGPMFASKPHFLEADPQLLKEVEGLKPDKQKHELKLEYEMITGSPISVANRIQFSMDVEPIEAFDLMANMTRSIIPIFWIEETLNLNKKVTNVMRYGLYWTQTANAVIKYSGLILGILGIIYAAYKMFMKESSAPKLNLPSTVIQTIQPSTLSTISDPKY